VANTTFGAIGGAGAWRRTPVSSYSYKDVGINVIVTPRVTFDGDVVLELSVENSAVGQDVSIAGQNFPSFASRKVETKIRLRDGESTLLAGLLREDSRRAYKGFPGPDSPAGVQVALHLQRHLVVPDRHRHAADSAHRARARPDAAGHRSRLHRVAAEPGADGSAAAHRRSGIGWRSSSAARAAGAPGQLAPAPGATGTLPQPGVVPQTPPAPSTTPPLPPQPEAPAAADAAA
jgi:general secretion pathway protein D